MDDRLDPRFAAAVRTALLDEVRAAPAGRPVPAPRPGHRRPRWQPVLALGIAAVTVVAIAVGFSVASRTRSSPPATVPLGGDCAEILTAHAASELIGKPLTLRSATSPLDAPEALALPVVGGLQCTWSGDGDAEDAAGLDLTVLPIAQRPKDEKAETGCFGENDGKTLQYACWFEVAGGGRWVTGLLTGLEGGTQAQTEAEVADLRRSVSALPAAKETAPLSTTGWWSRTGCTTLGERADLPAVLDQPKLTTDSGNGGMTTAGQGAALARSMVANCIAEADTATTSFVVEIHAFGGAGAIVRARLEGPDVRRLADVDGAEVYRVTDEAAHASTLWVVAAGGALELRPGDGDTKQLLPAVAPILKVLDAHVRR